MLFLAARENLHVLGSIHFWDDARLVLPEEAEVAFQAAQRVVFEHDYGAAQDLSLAYFPDGTRLSTVIPPDLFAACRQLWTDLALPAEDLERSKPWHAALTISTSYIDKAGLIPGGVDFCLYRRAVAEGKQVIGLEVAQDGLCCFDSAPSEEAQSLLSHALESASHLAEQNLRLLDGYRKHDVGAAEAALQLGMTLFPVTYQSLIAGRSQAWNRIIRQRFDDGVPTLVVVGCLHCVGPFALQHLLAEPGPATEGENHGI